MARMQKGAGTMADGRLKAIRARVVRGRRELERGPLLGTVVFQAIEELKAFDRDLETVSRSRFVAEEVKPEFERMRREVRVAIKALVGNGRDENGG